MQKILIRSCLALAALALPGARAPLQAAPALTLSFPAPVHSTARLGQPFTSVQMAIGPFADGTIPTTQLEGALEQQAWQLDAPGLSTLQLLRPLRDQITAAGYAVIFECETRACGGFDFRYGIPLLPEPDMHVDLGDFRYLAASRTGAEGAHYLSLVVSKSAQDGFVQLTQVGPEQDARTDPELSPDQPPAEQPEPAGQADTMTRGLDSGEAVALEDLVFPSGSAELLEGPYASLDALSAWLLANPARPITLVGHTDASGSLASNVALSKRRAESVRRALITTYGVAADRVTAEGVGYLAPRASNLTDTGMQRNRRVEVLVSLPP